MTFTGSSLPINVMDSNMLKRLIYCDAFPSELRGGFFSLLHNLYASKANNELPGLLSPYPIFLHSSTSLDWTRIYFCSHRLSSFPFLFRIPLLLVDLFLAFAFCYRIISSAPSTLVVFVGTDPTALIRGLIVSCLTRSSHKSAYIVDNFDFEDHYRHRLFSKFYLLAMRKVSSALLNSYNNLYFVTEPLQNKFLQLYSLKKPVRQVSLPFHFSIANSPAFSFSEHTLSNSQQSAVAFGFVGLTTPLIYECLIELAEWALAHCQPTNFYVLSANNYRFDYDLISNQFAKFILLDSVAFNSAPFPADTVFLCPHFMPSGLSTDKSLKYSNLIQDSFPSKLLKLIDCKRPFIIIAPYGCGLYLSHSSFLPVIDPSLLFSMNPKEVVVMACNADVRFDLFSAKHSISNLFDPA